MSVQLSHKNKNITNGVPLVGKNSQWVEFWSLLKSLSIFLSIAFILRASVVEAFKIPSSSMVPTLEIGDHILVNKLSYGLRLPFVVEAVVEFKLPQRGDVVVFTQPDDPDTPEIDEADINIIKRVVGLPGDTVQVKGTKLYLNNKIYDEPYTQWVLGGKREFGPVTVPPGKILLLGDNRDQSRDARYWNDPFLDVKRLKGRAFIIYWNWPLLKRIFTIIS